ncbi:MAG: transposase family protein, partial [Nitrososphaera sp.]|nr:transposase family protein [Nitrososphaera sp.]
MNEQKVSLVKELHKPARKNYQRRRVDIRGLDETWQADLVDMSAYAGVNKGHKYMLTVIDTFSKYAWAVPMKTKSGKDTAAAMESVLRRGRVPKNLHVDQGKEFYNSNFESLVKRYAINLYSTFSNLKASICERFNRTLKNKMWMQFSLQGNYKWIDALSDLVSAYNNTKHRTIRMKPKDVSARNEK